MFPMNLNKIIIDLDHQFIWREVLHIQVDYKPISIHSHLCGRIWQTKYAKSLKTYMVSNIVIGLFEVKIFQCF